jgi:hypothetical protein
MNPSLKDRNDHINPNQIKFDLEGKIYKSGKDQDMAMITISNIDDFDFDCVYIAVINATSGQPHRGYFIRAGCSLPDSGSTGLPAAGGLRGTPTCLLLSRSV